MIRAIADLLDSLWPIAAIIILLIYRREITKVFAGISSSWTKIHMNLAGQDLEIERELREVDKSVDRVLAATDSASQAMAGVQDSSETEAEIDFDQLERDILSELSRTPKLAMSRLMKEIGIQINVAARLNGIDRSYIFRLIRHRSIRLHFCRSFSWWCSNQSQTST